MTLKGVNRSKSLVDLEQIRIAQEQRLLPVLKAWDEAKEHLEEAIELAKEREQEFHAISEDIRRNLSALDFVKELAAGTEMKAPSRPRLIPADSPRRESQPAEDPESSTRVYGGLLRRSSRPLFPNMQKTA